MFYFLLLLIAAAGAAAYVAFMLSQVPGAAEERLGEWEPVPEGVGRWQVDADSAAGKAARAQGLSREVRWLFDPDAGVGGGGKLVRQVRYRHLESNAIERVEPDEVVRRRRVKKA